MRGLLQPLFRLSHWIARKSWLITRPISVGVRLLLVKDQTVLLVKHTYGQRWYLPGGGVSKGETLEEAARREASEEIGAELGNLRLFGVYSNFCEHKSDHVLVFLCRDFALTGTRGPEIKDWHFFHFDSLPEGSSPGTGRRIAEYVNDANRPVIGPW